MSQTVIKIENLSKLYRVGEIGTGTISHDLNRWWATKVRGKEDPFAKVGQVNDRTAKAQNDEYVWALKDINLEMNQGDILGIIGKNGAGKSTLLKILSRVTSPTTGSIKVKGRLASLLEVGTGFHPEMTGRENIYMNGTIMGMRRWEIDKKLDEIIDFAGVAKYLDTPTKRYSSGMTVRLGFAIAAFLEPEILVVDEVLAVGDAEFQKKAIGKMQDVSRGEGRTVLFVSHNMGSIFKLCNKCLVLNKGTISFNGKTASALNYYQSRFENLKTKIADRKDRSGNGHLKVIDLKIFSQNYPEGETLINKVNMGSDLNFELEIKGKANNAVIGVLIGDSNNTQIIRAYTYESISQEISIDGRLNVKGFLKKLPLVQGNYFVHVWLGKLNPSELCDYLENATTLEVLPRDVYNTGKIIPKELISFSEVEWKLSRT